jgi:4-amino-4-deoxy-L-arabinose transferase-like glycosyltransferase
VADNRRSFVRIRALVENRVYEDGPLIGIVFIAFILRAGWLLRSGSQWMLTPDSLEYLSLAKGLIHHCGFARLNGACGSPEAFRTPGYPIFLAMALASGLGVRGVLFLQAILGAGACAIVGLIVKRKWNKRAALLAAGLLAFDIPSILFTKEIMTEALFQALLMLGSFIALVTAERPAGKRTTALASLSGLIFGLAALVRPIGVVLVPVTAWFLIKASSVTPSRRLMQALAALLVPFLIVAAWVARNGAATGQWSLSTEGAFNAYAITAATVLSHSQERSIGSVERTLARKLGANGPVFLPGVPGASFGPIQQQIIVKPELERYMLRTAFDTILAHPIVAAGITLHAFVVVCFKPHEIGLGAQDILSINQGESAGIRYHFYRGLRWALQFFQLMLLAVMWLGASRALLVCFHGCSEESAYTIFFAAEILLIIGTTCLFLGFMPSTRYRVPAIPFLAMLAGLGWFPERGGALSQKDLSIEPAADSSNVEACSA